MLKRKTLWIGSLILGLLGFSPLLLSLVNKGDKDGKVILNPKYYDKPEEELFLSGHVTKNNRVPKKKKN